MIRVPVLGIHAPWYIPFGAVIAAALLIAAGVSAAAMWDPPWPVQVWRRCARRAALAVTVTVALALTARQLLTERPAAEPAMPEPRPPLDERVPLPGPEVLRDGGPLSLADEQTWAAVTGERGGL